MPPRNLFDNFLQSFEQFKKFDFEELKEFTVQLPPWNELTIDDAENSYNEIIEVIDYLNENELIQRLPFNIFNSIVSSLRNVITHYSNLNNQRNQQHFHNFISLTRPSIYKKYGIAVLCAISN